MNDSDGSDGPEAAPKPDEPPPPADPPREAEADSPVEPAAEAEAPVEPAAEAEAPVEPAAKVEAPVEPAAEVEAPVEPAAKVEAEETSEDKPAKKRRKKRRRKRDAHGHLEPTGKYLAALALAALGVVYGDIGTSPLYALRECFHGPHAIPLTHDNVFGVLSLIFWSLILVISIKYLGYVMRADHDGEGGILALMALACPPDAKGRRGPLLMVLIGVFGSALLYGDGVITPAISVLSAVEGIEVVTPAFKHYVLPITIVILVALFAIQSRGTARVGVAFGPITLVWFAVIGLLGLHNISDRPDVFGAINPAYAVTFFLDNHWEGFVVLGSVFLVVTGGEALYADMGHFGPRPIRVTWFALVLPCLLLNYLGQGALLLERPHAAAHPFYRMAPGWALIPLVVLATMATCIASQAVISGAFSLSRQAVMLNYLPRVRIDHTSSRQIGQIYVPAINWFLMLMTIALVLGFRTSSGLAAAYGIAVTATMVITTVLAYRVATRRWGWSPWLAGGVSALFVVIDCAFFGSNLLKVADGGWFPLALAFLGLVLMTTWKRGREILSERMAEITVPWKEFAERIHELIRVPGTAIYMTSVPDAAPPALVHNTEHNHVLHEQTVLLMIQTEERPRIADSKRLTIEDIGDGCLRVIGRFGFTESPHIPKLLELASAQHGLDFDMDETTFVLGRETLLATKRPGMAIWREELFAAMSRNALRATAFFHIPPDRVMEIGVQIEL
jgi:KUP system potassium uptake protein